MNACIQKRFRSVIFFLSLALLAGCVDKGPRMVTVTFKIAPDSIPPGDTVFITGNIPELGSWDPDEIPMEQQVDGSWSKAVTVPAGTLIEYKITRGGWQTEMVNRGLPATKNLMVVAMEPVTVNIDFTGWKDTVYKAQGGIMGQIVRHPQVKGDGVLPRDIIVWLPPDYDANDTNRYPVIYAHDGQNLFDPATSFAGVEWRLDEAAELLMRRGVVDRAIIVAIYNTQDRDEEYVNTEKGRRYMDFVVNALKPMVDEKYLTKPDRENTSTIGSSEGGLISFLLAWNYDDVFSKAAAMSPAFFKKITRTVEAETGPPPDIEIYIDNGGVGLDFQRQDGVDRMLEVLQSKGFELGQNLEYYQDQLADHNEQAWSARVWKPLVFLLGPPRQ